MYLYANRIYKNIINIDMFLVMDNIDVNKRYICRVEFMRAFIYGTILAMLIMVQNKCY